MSVVDAKMPVVLVFSLLCLALGIGAGVLAMVALGYHWEPRPAAVSQAGPGPKAPGQPGKFQGKQGAKDKGQGPGGRLQFLTLIAKLDVVTRKPLELTPEQKQKINDQLKGLETMEKLDDQDLQKRMEAILSVLKGNEEQLADVGFRVPGASERPWGLMAMMANPLQGGPFAENLKALQKRLAK